MKKLRWGIAGPGIIAHKFADAIMNTECAELVAVASRTAGKAEAFANEFELPVFFDDYEKMAKSDEIDVVYISTAHPFHFGCAELFLKAKKHVLCEKPMCINADQANRLKSIAEQNNVFLMEAMWTRFLPAVAAVERIVGSGEIGEVNDVCADFCYSIETEEDPKLFDQSLAGGSLLDVGVYTLHFADLIYKKAPKKIDAVSNIENGVDLHTRIVLKYDNGETASLSSAIKLEKPFDSYIYGTKGRIYIPDFYKADYFKIIFANGETREESYSYGENGFEFEIEEVCRCIREGKMQSEILPLAKTVEIIEQMDEVRRKIGLVFNE